MYLNLWGDLCYKEKRPHCSLRKLEVVGVGRPTDVEVGRLFLHAGGWRPIPTRDRTIPLQFRERFVAENA